MRKLFFGLLFLAHPILHGKVKPFKTDVDMSHGAGTLLVCIVIGLICILIIRRYYLSRKTKR